MNPFEKYDEEYIKFDLIKHPHHRRRDICAFLMLDEMLPGTSNMVCVAEHDEIWLDVIVDDLLQVATEYQIRDLVRCGVRYDSETDSLTMFV